MRHLGRGARPAAVRRRPLGFELLERRDLLAVIRLVDWNTINGPNDAAGDENFRIVVEAIGNETIQGNTKRIDVLAVQETDNTQAGGNSIGRLTDIFNSLYTTTSYASIVTTLDGGGDATGFVYDTSTISLIGSPATLTAGLTHNVLRAQFRPSGTAGESDFFVYTIHLKSGDTGADATTRGMEAAVLRADADSLNMGQDGAHVIMVGDFNMKTSSEAAYTNLLAMGNAQLQDVADAPGDWNDNPDFKLLHSQDPRTTMDDRFDIQFASSELFDGVGLEYVANSYRVFGNNGTHLLNQPITTGTGASTTVLNALVAASDHLPVVADYEVVISTPNVRITETRAETKVVEAGLYDTYYAVLDTQPAANVTVTVTPTAQLDVGSGAGVSRQLLFTPANWDTPQVVIVNAPNDGLAEGNHTSVLTHTVVSADPAYNGLSVANVMVKILDINAPTILINELDSDQVGTDAAEFVELYDGGIGNVPLGNKSLVFFNGNTNTAYRVISLNGMTTNPAGFFLVGNIGVPGIDVAFPDNTLQNGPDAVALYSGTFPNNGAVTTTNLLEAVVYKNGGADAAGLQVLLLDAAQPQVNENQNSQGTTQAIARLPDGGDPRVTTTFKAQAPTPKALNAPVVPGIVVLQSSGRVDVTEGGNADSYQIALLTKPTANVTVTIDPDSQTDLGAGAGVAIVLTFTPANAFTPQTVTVTAVDDAVVEGPHTSLIVQTVASADSAYNNLSIGNIVANIIDNDVPIPPNLIITEIMYNPDSDEVSPGVGEWVEIINAGAGAVDLGGWLLDDEDASNWSPIPAGIMINPGQLAVLFDSAFATEAEFRAAWSVPANALVIGVSWGGLANSPSPTNEILVLRDPQGAVADTVNFDDASPWPSGANGPSIYLKGLALDNNVGSNWARSIVNQAGAISPTGPIFSTADVGSPGRFFLPGDYSGNGFVDLADYVQWRNGGPLANDSTPGVQAGDYNVWRANYGNVGAYYAGGAAATAGEVIADAAAEDIVALPSAVSEPAATFEPAQVNAVVVAVEDEEAADGGSALDLVFDPRLHRHGSVRGVGRGSVESDGQAVDALSVDLLLTVDGESSGRQGGLAEVVVAEAAEADVAGLDEFFASLTSWEADLLSVIKI